MQILHIAAQDLDSYRREQLIRMATLYRAMDLGQLVLAASETGLGNDLEALGISCNLHRFGRLFDLRAQKSMKQEIIDFSPHIIQSHSPIAATFIDNSLKQLHKIHATFTDDIASPPVAAIHFYQNYGIHPPERHDIIIAPPLPEPGLHPASRQQTEPESQTFRIGVMLQPGNHQALDIVLQAIREIPGATVIIGGQADQRKPVENLALKIRMQERCIFKLWPEDAPALLDNIDIYASLPGGRADSLIPRLWASGIPIIADGANGRTPVADRVDGWLVSQGAGVLAWRQALAQLAAEPETRRALAARALHSAQKFTKPSEIIGPYLQAYKTLLMDR